MDKTPAQHLDTQPYGKRRTFWSVCAVCVRWVFIVLFAVILLGGLYFQAPWKILALDAVLLGLLTVVPTKKRKYGWLTLAAAVLGVVVWIFIPEKESGQWIHYSFDDEIQTYNARYAVPDEDNAAVILEDISLKYEDTFYHWPDFSNMEKPADPNVAMEIIMEQVRTRCADFYPDCWTDDLDELTLGHPWKSSDNPELAEWLKQSSDDINSLIEASKKPKCQFEYTFDPFPFSSFNDDPAWAMSEWLKLLRRAANNDWADGRIDDAVEKYNALFRLSHLLSQQPLWSLTLQGTRQYHYAHNSFSRFIIDNELNDKQFNSLEETIACSEEPDFELLFDRWFEYQRLSMKQLWATIYEMNEHGEFRYAHSAPDKFSKHSFKKEISIPRFKKQKEKLNSFFLWFWIPTTPLAMAEQIDKAYDRVSNMSQDEIKKEIENHTLQLSFRFYAVEPLMHAQLKGCNGMYERKEFFKLYRTVYRIYIALRRYKSKYGCWPDGLDQLKEFTTDDVLIDPMNESGFVYRKNKEDFTLYSKGKNGIDNQGIYERPVYDPNIMTKGEYYKLEPELDDIQLWPEELEEAKEAE